MPTDSLKLVSLNNDGGEDMLTLLYYGYRLLGAALYTKDFHFSR